MRDRFFLLETAGRHGAANASGVQQALAGDWSGALTRWSGLLADGQDDCRILSNIALARYLDGRHRAAFTTVQAALNACPGDERVRWNFRALSRPASGPRPIYRVLP